VSSIENRLRRLEGQGNRCAECGLTTDERRPIAVVYPDEPGRGFEGDPYEACTACGEGLYTVLRVVHDSPAGEEWGGAYC
jgi:hypothetical protein